MEQNLFSLTHIVGRRINIIKIIFFLGLLKKIAQIDTMYSL